MVRIVHRLRMRRQNLRVVVRPIPALLESQEIEHPHGAILPYRPHIPQSGQNPMQAVCRHPGIAEDVDGWRWLRSGSRIAPGY